MNDRKFSARMVIALAISVMVLTAALSWVVWSNPTLSFDTIIEEGSMTADSAYTMFRDGSTYYAKNGITGDIDYYGTNFTAVFEDALDALPTQGGKIHLKPAEYEGWLYIDRDGVIVEGEGTWCDTPTGIPDNSPTELYGTVIKVLTASQDAITITGQRYGVHIRDLGVWFNVSSTGHGITTDMTMDYTITHSTFWNLKFLNHDKAHYAIQLCNFLHVEVRQVMAWGGPLLNLYENHPTFVGGNSNFYNLYGYIKHTDLTVDVTNGVYPIFIHKNDSNANSYINLMHFYRIQINNPNAQTDADYYGIAMYDLRYSSFTGLNLEHTGNNTVLMGSCLNVQFINAFLWNQNNDVYVNIASNNAWIKWTNCRIEQGTILDSNETNTYDNCAIYADVDNASIAYFEGLQGNSGFTLLGNGNTQANISAECIGSRSSIFLGIVEGDNLAAAESLKVDQINSAGNWFIVECIDGGAASTDIAFFWEVRQYYP